MNTMSERQKIGGFTLIELIVTLIIVGILAVAVLPRFAQRNDFESHGFANETLALLRYAQKAAIAQHRTVCVHFSATQAWLTVRSASGDVSCLPHASPGAAVPAGQVLLAGPGGGTPFTITGRGATTYTAVPAAMYFAADGSPNAGQVIGITDAAAVVTVEATTGYVH